LFEIRGIKPVLLQSREALGGAERFRPIWHQSGVEEAQGEKMPDSRSPSRGIVEWFRSLVRPIFEKTEPAPALQELEILASQVEALGQNEGRLFPICLLGQAGVGKSTLINTLIADTDIVVPSGGGTGPLTANALRVIYGDKPAFVVRYHTATQVGRTRFILEAEIHRQSKDEALLALAETGDDPELIARLR
jgi:hypothetical protein